MYIFIIMLEWTICNNCGKIFDNSQGICSSCNTELSIITIDYLKDYLSNFLFVIKTLNIFKSYSMSFNDLNVSLESIILDDLFRWFSYLGLGDGVITENELEFINSLLNTSYDSDEILILSDSEFNKFPSSFNCLGEIEKITSDFGMNIEVTADLYECYKLFGKFFITVDNKLDENVFKKYSNHINYLDNGLNIKTNDFKPLNINKKDDEIKNEVEEESLQDYIAELNKLIGLENVKKDVNSLINLVQIRKIRESRGIKQPSMSLHLVFSGNPGTGKTTVARLLSKIYNQIGILTKGHLIETDRSGLVGGYVGQTAIKTKEIIESAQGGILFIDEAYSLTSNSENDYGHEAIDTILKAMEDNRDDFIVIVAGYTELMDKFLHSNPGLESRFNKFIHFDDYNQDELYDIFMLMANNSNLTVDEAGIKYLKEYFSKLIKNKPSNFANGRAVRNLFEEVLTNQANRLAPKENITDEELNTLTYEDFLVDENE